MSSEEAIEPGPKQRVVVKSLQAIDTAENKSLAHSHQRVFCPVDGCEFSGGNGLRRDQVVPHCRRQHKDVVDLADAPLAQARPARKSLVPLLYPKCYSIIM
jgi:hypothetical protein